MQFFPATIWRGSTTQFLFWYLLETTAQKWRGNTGHSWLFTCLENTLHTSFCKRSELSRRGPPVREYMITFRSRFSVHSHYSHFIVRHLQWIIPSYYTHRSNHNGTMKYPHINLSILTRCQKHRWSLFQRDAYALDNTNTEYAINDTIGHHHIDTVHK